MDSSGLMHLIATGGGTNVTDNTNDESVVTVPTDEQTNDQINEHISDQLPDENIPEDHEEEEEDEDDEQQQQQQEELPIDPSVAISLPMETELEEQEVAAVAETTTTPTTDGQPQVTTKTPHDIAEIHREMLNLIPIPQAWSHIRHQSGLFSYPDLPHFNVIRQATFREGRFVCPFCTVDFASKEGIRYHLYNSCTKSPYPKAFFRCLMCGSELADRSSLRTHLARHVSSRFHCFYSNENVFFSSSFKG
jgi:transposase-like protein